MRMLKILTQMKSIISLFLLLNTIIACASDKEYQLRTYSEAYNTRYFYCKDFEGDLNKDTVYYVPASLPKTFVVETGMLNKGEMMELIYNNDKKFTLSNSKGYLKIDNKRFCLRKRKYTKLSLYFVNEKMIVYLDDDKVKEREFPIDTNKRIGVRFISTDYNISHFFSCYEPVPFKVANYGEVLEDGLIDDSEYVRIAPHNVGEPYNLTFPSEVTKQSEKSIRFEYRYENVHKNGASTMQQARSEISGVFSNSPKNKWIIEYDLYVPKEMVDDGKNIEIITQLHEYSNMPTTPAFCLYILGGVLKCALRGDNIDIASWKNGKPRYITSGQLKYLTKGEWHHVKAYVKEGWQEGDIPLTIVWVDGNKLYESTNPNCFKYDPMREGKYDYLKFGIYKSSWLKDENVASNLQTRTYYFDNVIIKY